MCVHGDRNSGDKSYKILFLTILGVMAMCFVPGAAHAACGFKSNGDYVCGQNFTPPGNNNNNAGPVTGNPWAPYIPSPIPALPTPAELIGCPSMDNILQTVNSLPTTSSRDSARNHLNKFMAANGNDCAALNDFVDDLIKFETFMLLTSRAPCGWKHDFDENGNPVMINIVPKPVFAAYLQEKIALDAAWADNLVLSNRSKATSQICAEIIAIQKAEEEAKKKNNPNYNYVP